MQKIFDVEIDITSMTTEELQEAKAEIWEMLSNIEHQLLLRKMYERRLKPPVPSDTAKL